MKVLSVYYSMYGHIHRMASDSELQSARFQKRHVAGVSVKRFAK